MGYRKIEKKKPIRRVLQDTTTVNRTYVQNGATARLAVPCWYQIIRRPQHTHAHDREWHDHIGWPNPNNPDDSCQDAYMLTTAPFHYHHEEEGWAHHGRYLDLSQFYPIHLEAEGYTKVEVAFVEPPEGLSASGGIDDYTVRFDINPMCPAAIKEDLDVPYTVFVTGTRDSKPVRDLVAKGVLHILAGPIVS